MKKFVLLLLGILLTCSLVLSVNAENEGFTRAYTCKYYMKGKENDCLIKAGPHKIMSPNCPFLTPQRMNTLINYSSKCTYVPIYNDKTEKYTCTYKSAKCTVTITGKSKIVNCDPLNSVNVDRVLSDFNDGECVKEKSNQ